MVEHLVYTEGVGGSSPSPPTSIPARKPLPKASAIAAATPFGYIPAMKLLTVLGLIAAILAGCNGNSAAASPSNSADASPLSSASASPATPTPDCVALLANPSDGAVSNVPSDGVGGEGWYEGDDWSGADLVNCDLSGVLLRGNNFANANFTGANLSDAKLEGAKFTGANLTGANLNLADVSFASFWNANLTDANLSAAVFLTTYLGGANLTNADLSGVYLNYVDLSGANLTNANLTNVTYCETTMPDGTQNNDNCAP